MSLSPARARLDPPLTTAPNFDRLARIYRWMEWASFGPWLWHCRIAFVGECAGRRNALALGDGDGRFTARLLANNPDIRVDAVDASSAMLRQLLRRAASHRSRVQIHRTDIREWEPPARDYDLIVTHFFLDCLSTTEIAVLAKRLLSCAGPGATWVLSEFNVPENGFGRWIARPLITLLYVAFAMLTGLKTRSLPDHRQALTEAGLILKIKREWLGGLLVSELWEPRAASRDGHNGGRL